MIPLVAPFGDDPLQQGLRLVVSKHIEIFLTIWRWSITTRIETSLIFTMIFLCQPFGDDPLQQGLRPRFFLVTDCVKAPFGDDPLQQGLRYHFANIK